ncbi:MAG: hypothetical protein L0G89_14810, partial [Janibacter sp.]|nr:hypothetical protein [Janibacter sp.]
MMSARHSLRPGGVVPILLALLVLLGVLAPSASAAQEPRDVVLIGAPGLSWSDVTPEATPAIHSFA